MEGTALQQWVEAHCDSIISFMDYEPTPESEDELKSTLGSWLDNSDWTSEDRFLSLGADGTGGLFVVWVRAEDDRRPVLLLGSEGGFGVLTATPREFAMALAHGPWIDDFEEPASLTAAGEETLDEEERAAAEAAKAAYRTAVQAEFGAIPPLDSLTTGLDELNGLLRTWVAERCPHIEA